MRGRSSLAGLTADEATAAPKDPMDPNLGHPGKKAVDPPGAVGSRQEPAQHALFTLATVSYFLGDVRAAVVIAVMVAGGHRLFRSTARTRRRRACEPWSTAAVKRREADGRGVPSRRSRSRAWSRRHRAAVGRRHDPGRPAPARGQGPVRQPVRADRRGDAGREVRARRDARTDGPFELPNMCFMGANVVSGYATGVVVRTGARTYFGQLADEIAGRRVPTGFDSGIDRFTWLMIRFMVVMVPAVFLINGLTKHDWLEALLFAVAVAVGLTPEMLPMIVTVNLAKGAIAMSRKKVIVKRLNAIQNFGAMDVLCTDKTGTLTQDRIILKRHVDIRGEESDARARSTPISTAISSRA